MSVLILTNFFNNQKIYKKVCNTPSKVKLNISMTVFEKNSLNFTEDKSDKKWCPFPTWKFQLKINSITIQLISSKKEISRRFMTTCSENIHRKRYLLHIWIERLYLYYLPFWWRIWHRLKPCYFWGICSICIIRRFLMRLKLMKGPSKWSEFFISPSIIWWVSMQKAGKLGICKNWSTLA